MTPARRDAIIAAARAGNPPREIFRTLGCATLTLGMIHQALSEARRTDATIPRFKRGGGRRPGSAQMPSWKAALVRLEPHASKRRLTVPALVRKLVLTALDDNMIDAILDDGAAPW